MLKICTKCNQEKDLSLFPKRKSGKDGHRNECKQCKQLLDAPSQLKWRQNNPEKVRQIHKDYRKEHRQLYRDCQKKYRDKNGKEMHERNYKNNPQRRMYNILISRMNRALKDQKRKRTIRTWDLVGCDYETLKKHLESQFKLGMTWENHGSGDNKWHIDHIKPCASFDLTNIEEQKKCFHYTNLQPLWQFDNLSKHNKII